MTTPNTHPLAALLSQHPEECAAVVAVLCHAAITRDGANLARAAMAVGVTLAPDLAQRVLDAATDAGVVTLADVLGSPCYMLAGLSADRYAIARMGAAAWLRARVAP